MFLRNTPSTRRLPNVFVITARLALVFSILWFGERTVKAASPQVLWVQYGLAQGTLKLAAHTDVDPLHPLEVTVKLRLKAGESWEERAEASVDPVTAMAEFRIHGWQADAARQYEVVCGASRIAGTIRREPSQQETVKLMAVACVNDRFFPQANAVAQMVRQDPDLVFFAGDQIYESNAGGEIVIAEVEQDVPAAMANYLKKWRRFGRIFRDLLKDRPSILITDDHDVYAADLWGRGGRRMTGNRTTGGYRQHPEWVNAAERTQTWHLPDAEDPGPWGDGIRAYFTSLDYGGISFAILEDRKFKSAPSEALARAVPEPGSDIPNRTLEVIKDPAFDTASLDLEGLNLLGEAQEDFLARWARHVNQRGELCAVLSQSPFVNVGNYDRDFGDMDANGWPQSARNRALRLIATTPAVMICGDIHYGTILQHGIDQWGDGPWSFSVPAFSSNQNRTWNPRVAAQGGEVPDVRGSGNHHDRFGNKLTLTAKADGLQGYGMILFDKRNRTVTFELYTFDANREPHQVAVPGWPRIIPVDH